MTNDTMTDEMFAELLESVREGGAILRGERAPSRRFEVESPDVRGIREQFELSQSEFAGLLGISVKTLQNWEQGRRSPHGAARVLLQVAARHPDAVWDVVGTTASTPESTGDHKTERSTWFGAPTVSERGRLIREKGPKFEYDTEDSVETD